MYIKFTPVLFTEAIYYKVVDSLQYSYRTEHKFISGHFGDSNHTPCYNGAAGPLSDFVDRLYLEQSNGTCVYTNSTCFNPMTEHEACKASSTYYLVVYGSLLMPSL